MARIIVIDASPLIGLAIVDGLKWLPEIFGTVFLPESVKQEVLGLVQKWLILGNKDNRMPALI